MSRRIGFGSAVLCCLAATGAACQTAPECKRGADCKSGACSADGQCVTPTGGSGGASGTTSTTSAGGSASGGGNPSGGGSATGSGGGGICAPNHDGSIARSEVPLQPGLKATFLTAENATVDTTGQKQGDGSRKWDFSGKVAGDHPALVATLPLAGTWYESKFPGASYAAKLSDSQDLLGVFEIDDGALLLRGVVSPDPGPTRTELGYTPPVTVLSFPVTSGKKWSTSSSVSGLAAGIAAFYTELYQSEVDAHGTVATPFGSFDTLRVRVNLTRTTGVVVVTSVTHLFAAECFGTVASLASQPGQLGPEFSAVAEIRRLTP